MARLHEYQGKQILAANGFKIPRGRAASADDQAVAAAHKLGGEVVIKIQAWITWARRDRRRGLREGT